MLYEMGRAEYRRGGFLPSALFFYFEGGLDESYGLSKEWDPHMKRELRDYLDESLRRGWQIAPQTHPKIFSRPRHILRRLRRYDRLLGGFLPKLEPRSPSTGGAIRRSTAIAPPAAGWYEKDDITGPRRSPSPTRPRELWSRSGSRSRTGSIAGW
jgi:hypothetical protein